jgi:hypothetical protein
MNKINKHSINYLREEIEKDPDAFDSRFRNIQSFVGDHLKKDVQRRKKKKEVKVDFFQAQ